MFGSGEVSLSRKQASEFLTERGFRTAVATLATMAVKGGGPRFSRFGRRVLYQPEDLIEWAKSKRTPSVRSTSELRVLSPND